MILVLFNTNMADYKYLAIVLPPFLIKQSYDDIIGNYYPLFYNTKIGIVENESGFASYINDNNIFGKNIMIFESSFAKRIKLMSLKNVEIKKELEIFFVIDEFDSQYDALQSDLNVLQKKVRL